MKMAKLYIWYGIKATCKKRCHLPNIFSNQAEVIIKTSISTVATLTWHQPQNLN